MSTNIPLRNAIMQSLDKLQTNSLSFSLRHSLNNVMLQQTGLMWNECKISTLHLCYRINGCSWLFMAIHGCSKLLKMFKVVQRYSQLFVAIYGYSWLFIAVHGNFGCSSMFKDVHGYSQLFMAVQGCTKMFMAVHGCSCSVES